ncbi:MAG: RNA polymerase sporulation sigma factor SigH, partial [Armatimonadetes bacterium CG07_land_8_20_14_0_80_40_9]
MADYSGPARFKEMKDEEIVEVAQSGEKEAVEYLLEKYRLFVQSRLRPYFLV